MATYTIRHGSIAAVQFVSLPNGKEISVTNATDGSEWQLPKLPIEVRAAVNRQFNIVFALPYASREQFIKDSVPFIVEIEDIIEEENHDL